MRLILPLLLSLSALALQVQGQDTQAAQTHNYQSDVTRLRKIVINSLYSHKDIFLRELISNANDAIEKLRLTALTDKAVWNGAEPLNITIKAVKNEEGSGGRIIITDTGIGMTQEELTTNLGTLAKSGTSDFLSQAEGQDAAGTGNLIGAFGLGFYSSFLVADRVRVASISAKPEGNSKPVQHIFSSSSEESTFEVFPDPRGNTLGRGTEITLYLKDDALEYLDNDKLIELVNKHSSFSTSFPIFLFEQRVEEVQDEDESSPPLPPPKKLDEADDEEAIVEDVTQSDELGAAAPKMKEILVEDWVHLNAQPPLWMRDPKNVTEEEYTLFYQSTFRDFKGPLAWQHFSGETGAGVSFRAIIYVPSKLDDSYWQNPHQTASKDTRLMVKHVFITSDLGEGGLPKWASWVKVVIDAEDLPLNVSRETLQSTRFLKQIKQVIIKRLIQLFTRLAEDDPEKFLEIQKTYRSIIKLGAVEDTKNRDKLIALTRFATNQRDSTSLDEYLESKKQGQKQIFYLAELAKSKEDLTKSVFIEKLNARGYEVLLLNEPLDEILIQTIRKWKQIPFQDVAKAGLTFGDEDPKEEEKKLKELTEEYSPLLAWLKTHLQDVVREVVISTRLVTSPCSVVVDEHGITPNVAKLMSATSQNQDNVMQEFAKKQKFLEINPRSPLIQGLLHRVKQLPEEEEEADVEAEDELKEVASILIDSALVRSGFEVPDSYNFFSRVDRVLRRSLGVSETAPTDSDVKPAPPIDPTLPDPVEEPYIEYGGKPLMSYLEDEDDEVVVHDEL